MKAARGLERPPAGLPTSDTAHSGALAGVFAGNDHAGNDGALRNMSVELRRIKCRFGFGHIPTGAVALAMVRIEINPAERTHGRREVLRQPPWYDGRVVCVGREWLEIV